MIQYNVRGVLVHDAHLAATMIVHGVAHILTLNKKYFSRFDGITVLHLGNI